MKIDIKMDIDRENFSIVKDTDYDKHYKRTLKHSLIY